MITIRIKKQNSKQIINGCPWIMRHEAIESSEWLAAEAGSLARVETERGDIVGIGMINPFSQIVCRLLTNKIEKIDEQFFADKISRALTIRQSLINEPYYRLIHAEADGLSGLIIDRFHDALVVQVASAGMEKLQPLWLAALNQILSPDTIIFRNDFFARKLEGLEQYISCIKGTGKSAIEIKENSCIYFADLINGQKTGWFFDMRDNRKMIAELANGKTVLDLFSNCGGFGILAAKHGASAVTMVDSSELALDFVMRAAEKNSLNQCSVIKGDAVKIMENLAEEGKKYDLVIADPPAYIKNKKDLVAGLKAYQKIAQKAAILVEDGGLLFTASCSHHAGRSAFNKAILAGINKSGKRAEIIKQTGAARDHPLHKHLPQSEYLKGLLLRVY